MGLGFGCLVGDSSFTLEGLQGSMRIPLRFFEGLGFRVQGSGGVWSVGSKVARLQGLGVGLRVVYDSHHVSPAWEFRVQERFEGVSIKGLRLRVGLDLPLIGV